MVWFPVNCLWVKFHVKCMIFVELNSLPQILLSCLLPSTLFCLHSSDLMNIILHCKMFKHMLFNAAVTLTKTFFYVYLVDCWSCHCQCSSWFKSYCWSEELCLTYPCTGTWILQVLGLTKVVSRYCLKCQEFMEELNFLRHALGNRYRRNLFCS